MLEKLFKLKEHNTTVGTEVVAGLTIFLITVYIVIVNPAILQNAGIPKGPSTVATILIAAFGTIFMGLYANRPFAIAPYMGENAFIAFTVVKVLGYSWQTALGAVFIGGVLFVLLTVFRLRTWLARAIPENLKYSFAVGLGLFLTFIGLNDTGIVVLGSPGAPVQLGSLNNAPQLLAVMCFFLIAFLMIRKVKGAILIGILVTTFLSFISALEIQSFPNKFISMPPSLAPIFLKLDILGALKWGFFSVILTVFVMDFVDTMGTLIGLSARAKLLDKEGNLPQMERPMLVDAFSTVVGSLLGTTTTGTYIESAAGIEEGGRTGLTAVVTGSLFLICLFFTEFVKCVPAIAYGPALIIVGLLMIESIKKIDFSDYTEIIPAFIVIIMMSFTYNLGVGITAGFVSYPLVKLVGGKVKDVNWGTWVLSILCLLFFIFYPYA